MKSEKNIMIAFILNASFSIFELIGGFITNSVAIMSDAIHDFSDSLSIGISYLLEKKSKKKPDNKYTYGYGRYSIFGAFITTNILIIGSVFVIYGAYSRILNPVQINYDSMILFAIFGSITNLIAANLTKDGHSLNQKAVNLHMLEDVLGWIIVLIGSIIMKVTNIYIIDPIMSIGVSTFILINSLKNFKNIVDIFLEKTPCNISVEKIKKHILSIDGIINVHHIHLWSIDGNNNYATMHVIVNINNHKIIKDLIRKKLQEHGICHVTIEIENKEEKCLNTDCNVESKNLMGHHHHH